MRLDYGVLRLPNTILFGSGQIKSLGNITAKIGQKVLICTDIRFASLPIMGDIEADLTDNGCTVKIFDQTQPELPLPEVMGCVTKYKDFAPDVIIGIGGGSCMDMAKFVSLLCTYNQPLSDFYGEFNVPGPIIPIIAVPTTAGTGSEVTPVAVIADPATDTKVGVSAPELIPHTAICDPDLTLTCPAGLTAISGADALAHAIESYSLACHAATPNVHLEKVFVGKNGLTDIMGLNAIQNILPHLKTAVKNGHDAHARSHVMLGATLAGLAFGSAGTSAAHAIQYPVGACTKTAHGLGIGVLLPYVMEYNLESACHTYATIARTTGVAHHTETDTISATKFVHHMRTLFADIGIAKTLADIGVQQKDLPHIATLSLNAKRLTSNNPCVLDYNAMHRIVTNAYHGTHTL